MRIVAYNARCMVVILCVFLLFWGSIIGYSSVISLVDGLFKKRLFSAVEYSESVVWAQKMISERDIIGRQTFQKTPFYCCRVLRKSYLGSKNDFWAWYHGSTDFSLQNMFGSFSHNISKYLVLYQILSHMWQIYSLQFNWVVQMRAAMIIMFCYFQREFLDFLKKKVRFEEKRPNKVRSALYSRKNAFFEKSVNQWYHAQKSFFGLK